jgi:hypothetical protein
MRSDMVKLRGIVRVNEELAGVFDSIDSYTESIEYYPDPQHPYHTVCSISFQASGFRALNFSLVGKNWNDFFFRTDYEIEIVEATEKQPFLIVKHPCLQSWRMSGWPTTTVQTSFAFTGTPLSPEKVKESVVSSSTCQCPIKNLMSDGHDLGCPEKRKP